MAKRKFRWGRKKRRKRTKASTKVANVIMGLFGCIIVTMMANPDRNSSRSTPEPARQQIIAPTNPPRPTVIPSATNDPLVVVTLPPTDVPPPTFTPTNTLTPRPTNTPRPLTRYINAPGRINVRSCPDTDCRIVDVVSPNEQVLVYGTVEGANYRGNTVWVQVEYEGERAYVHSRFISERPASRNDPTPLAITNPTARPAPTQPISNAPANNYSCNCSRTCSQMSCREAYYQLNTCGCSQRDGDNDGKPCESKCGG